MALFDMRIKARECLARAKELLHSDDYASVRYACLELRFAIEYVTYDQLSAYLEEVPSDTVKKWTPKQIISELKEVDPHADESATIAFGIEETPGVPAKAMNFLGEDRRFSLKWANANHNALGSFLHAPTLHQIEASRTPDLRQARAKAGETVEKLEHILGSPLFRANFGVFHSFKCDCGADVRKRVGSFRPQDGIVCRNCGAIFDIVEPANEGGDVTLRPRTVTYNCLACQTENFIPEHLIKGGTTLKCAACGDRAVVRQEFRACRITEDEAKTFE